MYKYENQIVDTTTGEIVYQQNKIIRKVQADEFIQVYLKDMSGLMGIKTMAEYHILTWFWKFSRFPSDDIQANYVSLDAILFDKIKESTGLKEQSIRNSISSLSKKDILIKDKTKRGIYYLNPKYFWKGYITNKTKKLELNIDYDIQQK